ncbi:unnamed protein product [Alopecurus aequalis]
MSAAAMPSSSSPSSSSSSSSDDDIDDPDFRVHPEDDPGYRADNPDDDIEAPMPADAKNIVSSLHTKDDVDAVCKKYGVPKDQYTARPAGDLRACSSPPPGAVCLYAHALEAGMRVPLHSFFCDALAHFGIAPTQLAPNGWRIMAGFVVLCHYAGVPPSLAVLRHFFFLRILDHKKKGGWYTFQSRKDIYGLRFAGLPDSIKGWKHSFFFLSSPTPWPCPVEWGEPPKISLKAPVLTGEEKRSVASLLRVHGAAPVDIRTYLRDSSLAAAMISQALPAPAPPPLPPSSTPTSAGCKGMDPSVYGMMKTILAGKTAATQTSASANKVKSEPGSDAPLCGRKRSLDEVDGEEGPPSSVLPNSRSVTHGSVVPAGVCSPPPGFSRKTTRFLNGHDGDNTDWEAARELLRGAVSPQQERVFATRRPSDVVASCYVAVLQAANYASFSLGYALELEEKLGARDVEIATLRDKLEKAQAALR